MSGYKTATAAKSRQSCPTLCDPIDGSPPGSPLPGILQARTLEWVAIAFSSTTEQLTQQTKKMHNVRIVSLSFIGDKVSTAAQGTAPQITLKNCCKEAVGEGQYIRFW